MRREIKCLLGFHQLEPAGRMNPPIEEELKTLKNLCGRKVLCHWCGREFQLIAGYNDWECYETWIESI